jgi:hypothetical protein
LAANLAVVELEVDLLGAHVPLEGSLFPLVAQAVVVLFQYLLFQPYLLFSYFYPF